MKTIKIELNPNSIDNAIAELEAYRKGLVDRLKNLVDKLTKDGVEVARTWVGQARGDSKNASVDYMVNQNGDIVNAVIYLEGKDALFIEFGAGIAYNTGNEHPKAGEFGYGIGTYPSKHPPNKAINPGRWVYDHDANGKPIWSIGTEGTMPMFRAAENIRNNLITTAIETLIRG